MEEATRNNINPVRNINLPQHQNKISNRVKCPIFCESDEAIKNIILKAGKVNPKEKQEYAQDILVESRSLLQCSHCGAVNTDCLNCHSIARKYVKEYGYLTRTFSARDISNSRKI